MKGRPHGIALIESLFDAAARFVEFRIVEGHADQVSLTQWQRVTQNWGEQLLGVPFCTGV